MNRQGFTLIEVLIAIAITGLMSAVLFSALLQINTSINVTESLMAVNEKAGRLQQLFEHDLAGATTLLDNEPPKQQTKDLKATTTPESGQSAEKSPEEKSTTPQEKKIIKKIFYSTTKGNQLGTLTFVSNNPLLGFWSAQSGTFQAGKAKPCLVRITYELAEDSQRPGSYILTRQESVPLQFDQRSGQAYEVLDGIKSLSFKYTSKTIKKSEEQESKEETKKPEEQKNKKEQPQQQPKEQIVLTSDLPTWNSDEQSEEAKKSEGTKQPAKEKKSPLPVFVDIEAILWDDTQQREYSFVFTIEIITDTEFIQRRRPWSFMSLFEKEPAKPERQKG